MKNIIIAGSGLGGLAAGAVLAKHGFTVTVYSDCTADTHGYDWEDCMSIDLLERITGKKVPEEERGLIGDTRYHSPSDKADIAMEYNEGERPLLIERKLLSKHMIDYALESGVKIVWETPVLSALTEGCRVTGIKTSDGDKYADMVIDACGIFSPVRMSLPDGCLIEKKCAQHEAFYAYRAYYKREKTESLPSHPYNIHLLHRYEKGLSWCVVSEDFDDVLIGRFEPFGQEKVDAVLADFLPKYPGLTTERLRGGQYTYIPVRRMLSKLVCDGYAAVGDSAYMTIPMIGSGIDLALNAGELLADTIINDRAGKYSTRTLWSYQYNFVRKYGAPLIPTAMLQDVLLKMNPHDVDYFLDNGVVTAQDINGGGELSVPQLLHKIIKGAARLPALLEMAGAVLSGGKAEEAYMRIPENYTESAFIKWNCSISDYA